MNEDSSMCASSGRATHRGQMTGPSVSVRSGGYSISVTVTNAYGGANRRATVPYVRHAGVKFTKAIPFILAIFVTWRNAATVLNSLKICD